MPLESKHLPCMPNPSLKVMVMKSAKNPTCEKIIHYSLIKINADKYIDSQSGRQTDRGIDRLLYLSHRVSCTFL